MIDDVLHDMPEEYRDRFEAVHGEEPVPISELQQGLAHYVRTVEQLAAITTRVDLRTARALAATAEALLRVRWRDEPSRRLAQAAARYFVLEEDDDEITGVLSFDDDRAVLNAVCRALDRADLVVRDP